MESFRPARRFAPTALMFGNIVTGISVLASASVSLDTSVLYIGQAIGSAIGGVLYAREQPYAAGYVSMGLVALALLTVMQTKSRVG